MSLSVILFIILVGLVLIILEIFILPGLISGMIGIGFLVVGVFCAYRFLGTGTGHLVLGGSAVASIILLILSFRSSTWKRVTLNKSLHGKTNELLDGIVNRGDEGISLSRLAPIGTALINEHIYEVQSLQNFIDQNQPIRVISVNGNKIIVEEKK